MSGTTKVSVLKRKNPSDGSWTLSLRWLEAGGREVRQKAIRTGPKCGVREYRKAMALARRSAAQKRRELDGPPSSRDERIMPLRVDRAKAEFLRWSARLSPDGVPNSADGTIANKQRHLESFLAHVAERDPQCRVWHIHHVLRYHVAQWRDWLVQQGLGAATINGMIGSVSSWLAWAVQYGHCKMNVCDKLKRLREDNGRAEVPVRTPGDLQKLAESLDDDDKAAVVMLLACTGLRGGELKVLRLEDWDPQADTLTVPEIGTERTKKHHRTMPLCRQAAEALSRLATDSKGPYLIGPENGHRPLTSQVGRWLEPHKLTPHDLRRFFITAMETIGAPKDVINDLVGHSPGKVRAAYTPQENLEAAQPWIERFATWLNA